MRINAQDLTAHDWARLHVAVERDAGQRLTDREALDYANVVLGTMAAAALRLQMEASELGRGVLAVLLRWRISRSWIGPAVDRQDPDGLSAIVRLARELEHRKGEEE